MPFQFLDDLAPVTSAPPIVPPKNIGSTAGEPRSPQTPAESMLQTPPPSNGAKFALLDDSVTPPSSDDLQALMAQGYKPTNLDLRTIYNHEWDHPVSTILKSAKEGAAGIVQPFLKAPGEIKEDPSAARLLSSAGEGFSGAAAGTVGMVAKPIRAAYRFLTDPGLSDEEKFNRWKLDYLASHDVGVTPLPKSIMGSFIQAVAPDVAPAAIAQPYPNTSAALGTLAALPMFEGASELSGLNKLMVSPKLNLSGRALGLAGKTLEKAGGVAEKIGSLPSTVTEGVTEKVLGEKLAGKFGNAVDVGELPVAGAAAVLGHPAIAATLAGAKVLEKAAPMISEAGQYATRLAEADPASPFGRLFTVAKDTTAPEWMRALSDSWLAKVPAAVLDTTATGVKAGVAGGVFGGGLSALAGENPDEIGHNIGAGVALGVGTAALAGPALRKARILQQSLASVDNLYQAHIAEGIKPEALKNVSTDAMTWAATAQQIFGDGTKIRFAPEGTDSPLPKTVYGQAGQYVPETKTAWINLTSNRDPAETVLHEILHPIFDNGIANTPEVRQSLAEALTQAGQTPLQAKVQYVMSELRAQLKGLPPEAQQKLISDHLAARDAASQQASGDPDAWIYSELLSESAVQALYGTHPVLDVTNPGLSARLKEVALPPIQDLLTRMGVKFQAKEARDGRPATILPGFENVIDSQPLRKLVYKLIRAQKDFLPGISEAEPAGVPISKTMWGNHPGATLEPQANGSQANDFVIKTPEGRVIPRSPRQVKNIMKSRREEINALYPGNVPPVESTDVSPEIKPRKTPSGVVERSGTSLGPDFDSLTTVGEKTKAVARAIEKAIAEGGAFSGWYQQIGKGADWKSSVQKDTGAIEAQYKDFMPYAFKVDKQGNLLVQNYSLSAFERKAAQWAQRHGPISLDLWGGDVRHFANDVAMYLKNHAENLPGEANNLGVEKKNVINGFLIGGNRAFGEKNPLRPSLKGDDRQGVVRSYRLDRLETLEPFQSDFSKPNYNKQLQNLSPETGEATRLTDLSNKADRTPEEDRELSRLNNKSARNNSRAAFGADWAALSKADEPGLHSEQLLRPDGKFSPPVDPDKEHIVGAAVRMPDGKIFTGAMHALAATRAQEAGYENAYSTSQDGFLTNTGRFVDRDVAKSLALTSGQLDAKKAAAFEESYGAPAGEVMNPKVGLETHEFQQSRTFSPTLGEWEAKQSAEKKAPKEKPIKIDKKWALGRPGQDGIAKAWILPDGTPMQLGATWHHQGLDNSPELRKKYGIPSSKSAEDSRKVALTKGFVRINYLGNGGRLVIEARAKDWDKVTPAVIKFVQGNAGKIDWIDVNLFDTKVSHVTDSDSAKVFDLSNTEKVKNIPFATVAGGTTDFSPQASSQRFSPDVVSEAADTIAEDTLKNGGTTFNLHTGKPHAPGSKVFGVALYPERSVVLEPADVTPERIGKFITDNQDLLKDKSNNVGTWLDSSTGKVSLDVATALPDKKFAVFAGQKTNQKAIWDMENMQEIPTGGTGEPVAGLGPEAGRLQKLQAFFDYENEQPRNAFDARYKKQGMFSPDVAPKIFSQASKVIDEKFSGESMPKAQLAAMLRNPSNGVKAEEMKWSGLDDFLKGSGRVSKKEVQDFLALNNVKIDEVVKGGVLFPEPADVEDLKQGLKDFDSKNYYEIASQGEDESAPSEEQMNKIHNTRFGIDAALEDRDWTRVRQRLNRLSVYYDDAGYPTDDLDRLVEIAERIETDTDGTGDNTPDYEQYTLPGGENYKEILFTFDPKKSPLQPKPATKPLTELPAAFNYIHDSNGDKWGIIREDQTHARPATGNWFATKEEALKEFLEVANANKESNSRRAMSAHFQSSHWQDTRNVLAHARVNDRLDENNKPGLFIEEIQSDWHQQGRAEGYKGSNPVPASAKHVPGEGWIIYDKDGTRIMSVGRLPSTPVEDILKTASQYLEEGLAEPYLSAVPDAPFKTTWHEMVFRRLLQKAIEQGKTWLGWTTGEQQADRYSLSNHLSKVKVTAFPKYPNKIGLDAYNKAGTLVHSEGHLSKDRLPEYIGRELSERALADLEKRETPMADMQKRLDEIGGANGHKPGTQEYQRLIDESEEGRRLREDFLNSSTEGDADENSITYSGLDLKVGGEGMAGFYDKMLLDYAKKFGKKFGASVEDKVISGDNDGSKSALFTDRHKAMQVLRDNGEIYAVFPGITGEHLVNSWTELLDLEKEYDNQANGFYLGNKLPATKVHALPITPQMKESISKSGIPLFSPNPENSGLTTPKPGAKNSPMYDLDSMAIKNSNAAIRSNRKAGDINYRESSYLKSRGGIVLHSAGLRSTLFITGATAKSFERKYSALASKQAKNAFIESYFTQ